MTKADISRALVLPLVILSASAAVAAVSDRCLTGTAPIVVSDASQVRAVRALVDAACVCSSFDGNEGRTHRDYVRCAAGAISSHVDAGTLRSKCKVAVKRYYSNSTCGKLPNRHAQTCVQRSLRTGKVRCVVRSSTKSDGATPTNSCADRPGKVTRVACPAYTHCIDAADTDGNLVIAAPGDTGSCATSPTPTNTVGNVPTATPIPTQTATTTPSQSAATTTTATPTAPDCALPPSAAAELEANRAKWGAAGITTYDIDYQRSCACPSPGDVKILVTGGEITSVLDSSTGEEVEDPSAGAFGFNSVDGLFEVIATAIDECVASLDVEYDPEFGHPTSVIIDFNAGAVGDEISIRINGLHVAAIPTFPIALGECHFDPECMDQSCMPNLAGIPSQDGKSAWTAFFESSSTSNIIKYIPAVPGCSTGGATQRVRVGDMIGLANGQNVPILQAVSCILAAGQTTFTIPVIPCGVPQDPLLEIVGFARIEIDSVAANGVSLHGLWEE